MSESEKKTAPAEETIVEPVVEKNSEMTEDELKLQQIQQESELKAMQAQFAYQFKQLVKMAEASGMKLEDLFEKPPVATTVVLNPAQVMTGTAPSGPIQAPAQLKPGSVLGTGPNAGWVPWRKEHLDKDDVVTFTPLPIPNLVFPFQDENGFYKIKLDVVDLVCWLTCGIPNTVNKVFYDAYMNGYDSWRELEEFKRKGPSSAPWGGKGPDGGPAWMFQPFATTFGMDVDGHSLRRGGPTPLDVVPTPETGGEAPPSSEA